MLTPIRTPWLSLVGLLALVPIAWGLLTADLTLDTAALRVAVLVGGLALVDRLVLPFTRLVLEPTRRGVDRQPTGGDTDVSQPASGG